MKNNSHVHTLIDALCSPRFLGLIARVTRQAYYLGNEKIFTQTYDGRLLILDTKDIGITPHILRTGTWEKPVTRCFKRLIKPGMVVIEVGSNIGYFTTLAAKLIGSEGHVHAFEANPRTYSYLLNNIDLNFPERITSYQVAATNTSGIATLSVPVEHAGSGSIVEMPLSFVAQRKDSVISYEVSTATIDAVLGSKNVSKIDFVKIDAEGSELAILEGMEKILGKNPHVKIILEYYEEYLASQGISREEFFLQIQKKGFTSSVITEKGIKELKDIDWSSLNRCDLLLLPILNT